MFFFLSGLIVGSFLNVLIYRLPKNQSILGRSFCAHCRYRITWYDNLPLLSFLLLRGKCRHCRRPISLRYPLIELAVALLFWLWASRVNALSPVDLFIFFLLAFLVLVAVVDLLNFLILDRVLATGLIVTATYFFLARLWPSGDYGFCRIITCSAADSVWAIVVFGSLLTAVFILSHGRGLGLGDVKFSILLGFIFGLVKGGLILYLAVIAGAFVGLILLASGRAGLKTKLPFGSFISASAIVFIFWGQLIIDAIQKSVLNLIFR